MPDGHIPHNLGTVAALRARLWKAGYRPVALYSGDKRPFGDAWQQRARRDPPEAAEAPPRPEALNTGVLCDGLRALDIDLDDAELAARIEAEATSRFGTAPVRWRENSGRRLLVYRAAEGEPPKRVLTGTAGKLEVLGRGQQFHAYGRHPSGALLRWRPAPLEDTLLHALPAVTEDQITALFATVAPWIGAEAPKVQRAGQRRDQPRPGAHAAPAEVAEVLARIPNTGPAEWERFNLIGMAIFAALGGADEGLALFRDWAKQNPSYDAAEVEGRWANYFRSPPDRAGLHTLRAIAAEAAPWPAPELALATAEALPAPPLPLDLFPGRWPRWIARAAAAAGAPPDYVACALLPVVGAAIGNARWASPWDGWKHPPVVNVACVGLPSAGKSPAINAVAEPMAALEADLNEDFEERMREWRTARQEAKERRIAWEAEVKEAVKRGTAPPPEPLGAREPDQPWKRRTCSTDPTMEAARDLSAANPRGLLLHRDELAGWIAGMDAYGNAKAGAARAFWLQAYEGSRWTADRVKDGDNARDVPHLTWAIVGGIQPDRLATLLLHGDDDGLSARFIYCWPEPSEDISDPPNGAALPFAVKERLRRLRELPMPGDKPSILPFTAEAIDALQDARRTEKQMEREASGLFLSWLGKLPGMAVRLSLVFLYLDWLEQPPGTPEPEAVDLDAIARALGFLFDYAVPMARRAFGEAALPEAERDARRLARWLLRQSPIPETLNARLLRRMAHGPGIPTPERIEAALRELAELHLVRPAPARAGGGKGRQRADWAVNPTLQERPT